MMVCSGLKDKCSWYNGTCYESQDFQRGDVREEVDWKMIPRFLTLEQPRLEVPSPWDEKASSERGIIRGARVRKSWVWILGMSSSDVSQNTVSIFKWLIWPFHTSHRKIQFYGTWGGLGIGWWEPEAQWQHQWKSNGICSQYQKGRSPVFSVCWTWKTGKPV